MLSIKILEDSYAHHYASNAAPTHPKILESEEKGKMIPYSLIYIITIISLLLLL